MSVFAKEKTSAISGFGVSNIVDVVPSIDIHCASRNVLEPEVCNSINAEYLVVSIFQRKLKNNQIANRC